jgi:hypothetical protein
MSWRPISAYWAGCHFRSHFWAKVIGPQGTQSFYLASFWLRPITPCRATVCSGLVLGRLLHFRGPFELAANIGLLGWLPFSEPFLGKSDWTTGDSEFLSGKLLAASHRPL